MKEKLTKVFIVVVACVACVLLNCGLIWLGYPGLMLSTIIMIAALLAYCMGTDFDHIPIASRATLMVAMGFQYVFAIWFPEVWIVCASCLVMIILLLAYRNYNLTEYTAFLVLYIITWDIAFYLMGDPVLEWVDAVLAVSALACCGIWIYHGKTLKA